MASDTITLGKSKNPFIEAARQEELRIEEAKAPTLSAVDEIKIDIAKVEPIVIAEVAKAEVIVKPIVQKVAKISKTVHDIVKKVETYTVTHTFERKGRAGQEVFAFPTVVAATSFAASVISGTATVTDSSGAVVGE